MDTSATFAQKSGLEIAVIGMSGRFPGARNVEEFWRNLQEGVESISVFSDQELAALGIEPALLHNPNYVKAGGVLEGIELFDAPFFGYSPREAEIMDPQQRFFLECAWEALENAGYDPEKYDGLIGLYAGASLNRYFLSNLYANRDLMTSLSDFEVVLGSDKDYLATRVSYKFNLKGPSINVNTACSTSLVAIHLACQSLLSGESDMVLAGGVSIGMQQRTGYLYQEGGIASPDGHCRAFDAYAQGTVDGYGVGVVVLKRLEDSLTDGDYIYGVIKGSAVNNDGSQKIGYTAPSVDGQAKVIRAAHVMAGIEPETVSYIEAHGTGTLLGDSIELAALAEVFPTHVEERGFCAIGSVKTNIGHLDAAAGVAGFIKTVLSLKHRLIPPSLNYNQPNPQINLQASPFYVNTKLKRWEITDGGRRAGVSAFGIGGTNAHVILEEAPVPDPSSASRPYQLLLLSARTEAALETTTLNLRNYLQQEIEGTLADVAYTLQVGRRPFEYRRIVVCQSQEEAVTALNSVDLKHGSTSYQTQRKRPVAFMFPGIGEQYISLAQELYHQEATFRETVEYCCTFLHTHLSLDVRDLLCPPTRNSTSHVVPTRQGPDLRTMLGRTADAASPASQRSKQTVVAQPAVFIIEYALARLLMQWGIHPQALVGYSLGEYVAACISGVFSLEDALTLVARRAQLIQDQSAGAMLAVSLDERLVVPWLDVQISLAAINSPTTCVLAGPLIVMQDLERRLSGQGIPYRRVETTHAFHSTMLTQLSEPLTELVQGITLHPPQIPYISNVTGTWISAEQATNPSYWARHMCETVRFAQGAALLLQEKELLLLEVGPGQALSSFVKQLPQCDSERMALVLPTLSASYDQQSGAGYLLEALGKLWLAGVKVDWQGFYAGERRRRLPLPTYPFEHQRYWIEPQKQADQVSAQPQKAGKRPDITDWFYIPSWKRSIPPRPVKTEAPADQRSQWVVFVDAYGPGVQLVKRLEQEGHAVIVVRMGQQFGRLSEHEYSLNPRQSDDYVALFKELCARDKVPQTIVHFWSITPHQITPSGSAFFAEAQYLGYYSLLFLIHALEKENLVHLYQADNLLQIAVASNYLQSVTEAEVSNPEKATLLGPCKVIPQEYPGITCSCIDIVVPPSGSRQEAKLIDQLLAEVAGNLPDSVIAYRGDQRNVQTFEAIHLDYETRRTRSLRQKGVYLITGGLGGVGLLLGKYLARTVQARLVLVGRSALPPKESWAAWLLTHNDQDDISRKIQKIREIEESGGDVLVVSADIADEKQMQLVMDQTFERFGTLHGVLHAAGITYGKSIFSPITEMDQSESEQQFHPKVHGLYVLENALQARDIDFCLLFSSNAAVLGGLGFVAYSAANLFLDAFATNHTSINDVPWLSANWDGWPILEGESQRTRLHTTMDQYTMTPEEAVEAFELLVTTAPVGQVTVSTGELQTRLKRWIRHEGIQATDSKSSLSIHLRPNLQNTYIAPRNTVEQEIAQIWQNLLNIKQVGIHDNFFELGGDSLLGIQIIAKAREAGLQFTLKQVFQYPTIAELAAVENTNVPVQDTQDLTTLSLPLTPIQHWFFEHYLADFHRLNQAVLLEMIHPLDPILLEKALQHMLVYHDALRLRFTHEESGWRQINTGEGKALPFLRVDLTTLSPAEQVSTTEEIATELPTRLNLVGPLIRAVFFDLDAHTSNRLLLVVHRLVIDAVSWKILLEDLNTSYQQLAQGAEIRLPSKSTSFQQWVQHLEVYAQSAEFQQERTYWLADLRTPRLPVDEPESNEKGDPTRSIVAALTAQETHILVQEIPGTSRTNVVDVLLTALGLAVMRWSGTGTLLVDLEDDSREEILGDERSMDMSRTVGWFSTRFPVLLNLGEVHRPGEALKTIKEQLRRIPKRGIGYGLLRYLSQNTEREEYVQQLAQAEIGFTYLDQRDQVSAAAPLFRSVWKSSRTSRSSRGHRFYLLEVNGCMAGEQLQLEWTYSENLHCHSTIESLVQKYMEALRLIIAYCQSPEAQAYTPADFPEANLSQQELDGLLVELYQLTEET